MGSITRLLWGVKQEVVVVLDGCRCDVLQVMVMGATNRPQDMDPAILRRMPATFHIGLPVSHTHTRTQCATLNL